MTPRCNKEHDIPGEDIRTHLEYYRQLHNITLQFIRMMPNARELVTLLQLEEANHATTNDRLRNPNRTRD